MPGVFQRNGFAVGVLIGLTGLALWLLLAGPGRLFGLQTGVWGILLLAAGTWGLLYGLSRIPAETLDAAASPAEWNARIGLAFCAVAIVYFVAKSHVFSAPPGTEAVNEVGHHLVMLLVAWAVVSGIVASRWKGAVEQDERDREIATKAADWGRSALIVCVIAIAVALAFTPADRLTWATPPMIGNVLILALMQGWFCEYVATLGYYIFDSRSQGHA